MDSHPGWERMTVRDRALAVNRWVRQQNLTGMEDPEVNYRNLKNCLLGYALRDEEHPSLPIISAVIFCSVSGRLGLNAHCCAIPGHVHAVVFAEEGQTLDGDEVVGEASNRPERMFLDPYNADGEITKEALQMMVSRIGWLAPTDAFLDPMTPAVMVLRMARNIQATFTEIHRSMRAWSGRPTNLLQGIGPEGLELALYGTAWAGVLFAGENPHDFNEVTRQLEYWFNLRQIEDVWLLEKHFFPLAERILGTLPEELDQGRRHRDCQPITPRVRTSDMPFRVGQVVQPVRHQQLALICAWKVIDMQTYYDCM